MKLRICVLAGTLGLVASVHADPIVTTTFAEDVFVETDTFETSSGSVLFTLSGMGYTDWLNPSSPQIWPATRRFRPRFNPPCPWLRWPANINFLQRKGRNTSCSAALGRQSLTPMLAQASP